MVRGSRKQANSQRLIMDVDHLGNTSLNNVSEKSDVSS
jgi:hypothetical protein